MTRARTVRRGLQARVDGMCAVLDARGGALQARMAQVCQHLRSTALQAEHVVDREEGEGEAAVSPERLDPALPPS